MKGMFFVIFVSLFVVVGFGSSTHAQACYGNPLDPPFNWTCGGSQPQEYCGSSDPNTDPSAVTFTITDDNGGSVQPGDWLTVTVTMHDVPAGVWWEVFWLGCSSPNLSVPTVTRMPCKGRPLTPDQKVQDQTAARGRLFVMHWYGTYPCESPSTVIYTTQVDPAAQVGDPVTITHEVVGLRINALHKLRLMSQFLVGDVLPQPPITTLAEAVSPTEVVRLE